MAPPQPPSSILSSLILLLLFFFFFIFSSSPPFSSVAAAEEDITTRAPHGIQNQTPLTFSPTTAAEFFRHQQQLPTADDVTDQPCSKLPSSPGCTTPPLPVAARVSTAMETSGGGSEVGGGGIVGIVLGVAVAVCLAIGGVYYVVTTRRANNVTKGSNGSVQTDHV